jgi:hypothetical protein
LPNVSTFSLLSFSFLLLREGLEGCMNDIYLVNKCLQPFGV